MIAVVNNQQLYEQQQQEQHPEEDPTNYSSQVEISVADDRNFNASLNEHERDILHSMMKNKARRRSSSKASKQKRRARNATANTLHCSDSLATASTEQMYSPYLMSGEDDSNSTVSLGDSSNGAVSSASASFSEPLKTRLSREEENAFMMSENTGDFCDNYDSFGSLDPDDDSFLSTMSSRVSVRRSLPSGYSTGISSIISTETNTGTSTGRKGLMRPSYSTSSITNNSINQSNSKRSLYSVNEGQEVHPTAAAKLNNSTSIKSTSTSISIATTTASTDDDISVDISLDLASIFEDRAVGKKLTPVKEKSKLRRKKSTRSIRSSQIVDAGTSITTSTSEPTKKSKKSSTTKKKTRTPSSPKLDLSESADDILKRWNSKIELIEKEAEALDKAEMMNHCHHEESIGDMGLSAPREMFAESSQGEHFSATSTFSPRLTTPRPKMTRHLSISCISSAGSSLSGDSTIGRTAPGTIYKQRRASHQGASISVSRRPSLHSLFEWNKQPSQQNLMDPTSALSSPIVNTSRQPDRRSKLRRSMSTTDISQYNNTPHWPPNRRQLHRNLHAQFYRRDSKLPTRPTVNRTVESSPVVTTEQLLGVMEPVTMRDILAFNELVGASDNAKNQGTSRKLVNYGDILDNASSNSLKTSSTSCGLRGL